MIDFKTHIKLSEKLFSAEGVDAYLENLELLERVRFVKSFKETYPLKEEKGVSDLIKDSFEVYDNVFDLVLGQFIMVEQILTGKFKFKTAADMDLELMTYILRPKGEVNYDNTDSTKEAKHREAILKTPVQDLYNVVNKFLENRDVVLFRQFSGVFYATPDPDETNDNEFTTPGADEMFNQQWYWYSIVRMLAKEDIRIYDEIYMLKMNVVLPEMSYLAQKNKIEAAQQRQAAAMSRL